MSSLRRLARDHATLRASLPPNYLFPHSSDPTTHAFPDDLTNLAIYLSGPTATPYISGLFLLHLRIPPSYPANPPTATFRTKIFHPNVDEKTGAICLETLKRDWDPKLSLRDILIHISCLLLQPNPDSALNENAGVLVREDYSAFERKARLMTKIHASIPQQYKSVAEEARTRGEDEDQDSIRDLKVRSNENGRAEGKSRHVDGKACLDSTLKESNLNQSGSVPLDVTKKSVLGKRTASIQSPFQTHEVLPQPLNSGSVMRNGETGEPLRKSPKHDTKVDKSDEVADTGSHTDSQPNDSTIQSALDSSQNKLPETVHDPSARPLLLRKRSNIASGKLRSYARIGIKRL